ncbi:uncharacterized protein [Leptinotarsa decemlineata]|uniref:uncharacterized protein n=1 Tax=Leptinotarsa decemlineata TaxID=7539 RepID=UPI003D308E7F
MIFSAFPGTTRMIRCESHEKQQHRCHQHPHQPLDAMWRPQKDTEEEAPIPPASSGRLGAVEDPTEQIQDILEEYHWRSDRGQRMAWNTLKSQAYFPRSNINPIS